MPTPEWVKSAKAAGLAGASLVIGIERRGRGWGPCPACRAARRGSEDPRPPVGTTRDGVGWECHVSGCGAAGDAVDAVALRTHGHRLSECSPSEKSEVRALLAAEGLCNREDDSPAPRPQRRASATPTTQIARPRRSSPTAVPEADGDEPTTVLDDGPTGGSEPADGSSWPGTALAWSEGLPVLAARRLWEDPDAEPVRRYLTGGVGEGPGGSDGRRFPEAIVRKWRLGAHLDREGWWWVTIPLLTPDGSAVNVKFRRVPNERGESPKPKYRVCKDRPLPLFARKALANDLGHPVIIVEGELDVVAAACYQQRSVVSGTAGAGTWLDEWAEPLEPYASVILGLDNDGAGEDGVPKIVESVGRHRCAVVTWPEKDLGECWLREVPQEQVEVAIARAKPMSGLTLRRVGEYADRIRAGVRDPSVLVGFPTGSRLLDALFGGWPWGLTVITGASGHGKTTFAAWAAREQALATADVVVTAFEQQPLGVVAKLVRQQLRKDLFAATDAELVAALGDLNRMGIHVADHYGRSTVADVIDTARYAKRRFGVRWFMIDHLGYLVDSSKDNVTAQIDHAVKEFAMLGAQEQIAMVLIAHPDKTHNQRGHGRVKLGDLKGSSSIGQEASLGLVVEQAIRKSGNAGARVHCDKLRGEWAHGSGSSEILYFDPRSCLYADRWDDLPIRDTHPELRPPDDDPPPRGEQ